MTEGTGVADLQQLKAEAYDLLVTLERVQGLLRAKNQEIAEALAEPQPNGAEPVASGS